MSLPLPNSTQFPNELVDLHMPDMTEAELKVVLAVLRHTLGNDAKVAPMSVRFIARMTGLSKSTVLRGLAAAIERQLVVKFPDKNRGAASFAPLLSASLQQNQGVPTMSTRVLTVGTPNVNLTADSVPMVSTRVPTVGTINTLTINTHSLTGGPAVEIFAGVFGADGLNQLKAQALSEIYTRLGEAEYRRLIEWAAGRPTPPTLAQLRRAAASWKPAWTQAEKDAAHANRNPASRGKPHNQPRRPAGQTNRPTAERLAADRALAEERRRKARQLAGQR